MGTNDYSLQAQIDDLLAQVTRNRFDIEDLTSRADAADERADAAERRADEIEAQAALDREIMAALQVDAALSRDQVAHLEKALASSRTIGAAVGILMASRNLDQEDAVVVLKQASSRSNTPLRELAETIVADQQHHRSSPSLGRD